MTKLTTQYQMQVPVGAQRTSYTLAVYAWKRLRYAPVAFQGPWEEVTAYLRARESRNAE